MKEREVGKRGKDRRRRRNEEEIIEKEGKKGDER
jgi:hypothetical protein